MRRCFTSECYRNTTAETLHTATSTSPQPSFNLKAIISIGEPLQESAYRRPNLDRIHVTWLDRCLLHNSPDGSFDTRLNVRCCWSLVPFEDSPFLKKDSVGICSADVDSQHKWSRLHHSGHRVHRRIKTTAGRGEVNSKRSEEGETS